MNHANLGYRTQAQMKRAARQHHREQERGMQMLAGALLSLAASVVMILAGVLIADYVTGLEVVSTAITQAMR